MNVIGLDGKTYRFSLTGFIPSGTSERERSSLHKRARALLKEMFPCRAILEEVFLPGCGLYGDFYLPAEKLMIETHGEQHYKFIPHFHGSSLEFKRSQRRDKEKIEWCELNNITLIEFPFNEDDSQWKTRIIQYRQQP